MPLGLWRDRGVTAESGSGAWGMLPPQSRGPVTSVQARVKKALGLCSGDNGRDDRTSPLTPRSHQGDPCLVAGTTL